MERRIRTALGKGEPQMQQLGHLFLIPLCYSLLSVPTSGYDETMGPCEQRMQDTDAGRNPISSCNVGTVCADHIYTDPTAGRPADLEVEGWFVFIAGSKVFSSDLKQYEKQELGSFTDPVDLCISQDGEWIMVETKTDVHLMKPDGSRETALGMSYIPGGACFYKQSPRGTLEIAYMNTGSAIFAVEIDTSKSSPELLPQTERKIAKNMENFYGQEFDVAGDIIAKRATVKTTIGDYYVNKTTRAAVLFTIPEDGMGIADKSTAHKSNAPWNCGITLSPSGEFWAANHARIYSDCIPENHKGFLRLPVRRNTDTETSMQEWIYSSGDNGGVVFWCPETWNNKNLRNGTWRNQEFHYHSFANSDEYTICVHRSAPPYNCWLVNHSTGTWTPLMTEDIEDIKQPDVFLTSETSVRRNSIFPGATSSVLAVSRGRMLHRWMNILGRTGASYTLKPNASGVYIHFERKNVKTVTHIERK